jgi:predicted N-acyltransferase
MQIRIHNGISEVAAEDWNTLVGAGSPFTRHEFLHALEAGGAVGPGSGWQPRHITAWKGDRLLGALPLYLKHDSFGEFVFDWSWAHAWQQAGMAYYPKLVTAIPFSPVPGRRFLLHAEMAPAAGQEALTAAALDVLAQTGASTWHILFPEQSEAEWLQRRGFLVRQDTQFHWHDAGYTDFEDYLSRFTSAKRKKVRRERRRVREAGIHFRHGGGNDFDDAEWRAIYRFYAITYLERGRQPYLPEAVFENLRRSMPEQLVVVLALHAGEPVAAALCLRDETTLYGRHWGALADYHSLHFETCYYQGIEYCLANGLKRFEPGTQGEHKVSRGFAPVATHSAHWIPEPAFRAAVADFLHRETPLVREYRQEMRRHLPFRCDRGSGPAP